MPKYIIERTVPGAGSLDRDELRAASVNSNGVLERLGPEIQWVQSYVTDDKITCVYIAPTEEMVYEHARQAGLPADAVMELRNVIDPSTAESEPAARRNASATARSLAPLVLVGAVLVGLTACTQSRADLTEPGIEMGLEAAPAHAAATGIATALAALRRATAPYHSLDAGQEAGWTVLVPRCRDNQPVGGMGWHYANPSLIDGELNVTQPEALIYEPQENGTMAFVGVEYVVPFSVLPADAEAPTLLGQTFLHNFGDRLWMLHVWVGRHNPNGMFATWNPKVSCQYAQS